MNTTFSRDYDLSAHGFIWSEYMDAWVHEDDATKTNLDGWVDEGDTDITILTCDHSGVTFVAAAHDHTEVAGIGIVLDAYLSSYYWWSRDDSYHDEPEPRHDTLPNYHNGGGRGVDGTTPLDPYLIGCEIEKEDAQVRQSIIDETISLPPGWVAEEDGSLDDSGFEIVTPAYNLARLDVLCKHIDKAAEIVNAQYSVACGGHITISDARHTASELADRIRPLFPLLFALYPGRLHRKYAAFKKYDALKGGARDRYAPIYLKEDRKCIELRVISAVPSVTALKWRLALIAEFLRKSYDGPVSPTWTKKQLKPGGVLHGLLIQVYPDEKQLYRRIKLYEAFSVAFFTDRPISEIVREYIPIEAGGLAEIAG